MLKQILQTDDSKTTLLIRFMVGRVFLSEGIQKFLYPAQRGIGRFEGMGFPAPELFGNFVGVCEILAGLLILFGLFTCGGAFLTFCIMSVAIIVTKIPIAFGASFGPFELRGSAPTVSGAWPTKCAPTGRCGWGVCFLF